MTTSMPSSLRENLVRLMAERGLSQTELARRAKVPQSTISRIVSGAYGGGRWATIEAIAHVLGVSASELAGSKPGPEIVRPARPAPAPALAVGRVGIGDLLPVYIASEWFLEDHPSHDEMRWLAGLGLITWTGSPPTAETIHVLITEHRKGKV